MGEAQCFNTLLCLVNDLHRSSWVKGILVGAGYFEDQVAVFIGGTTDEKAATVKELYLGLKDRTFIFHHRQGDISPAAANFLRGDLQAPTPGQGYRTGLPRFQVEAFTTEQAIGGVIEHGLQLTDMALQLWIDPRSVA